jgi:hypothetical protein
VAPAPDRPDRVNDVPGLEPVAPASFWRNRCRSRPASRMSDFIQTPVGHRT